MPTVNLLIDCLCSIQFSASDLGGGESYTGPISFKADEVSVKQNTASSNHATGQDSVAMFRKGQLEWEVSVKTKLYNESLFSALQNNDLAQITVTAPAGFSFTGKGLIQNNDPTYAMPSDHSFMIKAHGTALDFS